MQKIQIHTPYITLGQLLKKMEVVNSGGEAKLFLQRKLVKVNQLVETRRGRKIYPNDQVEIQGYGNVQVFTD
jgi:ribosome-associated protein